jgi:GntR family transcriptional regulator, transcriptional repressor for pyruvate dehydrogenase complex
MAASRISLEEIASLHDLLHGLGPEPSIEKLVANDLKFHRRTASACGNKALASLLGTLSGPTTRARIWRGLTQRGATARTLVGTGPSSTRRPPGTPRWRRPGPRCTSPASSSG